MCVAPLAHSLSGVNPGLCPRREEKFMSKFAKRTIVILTMTMTTTMAAGVPIAVADTKAPPTPTKSTTHMTVDVNRVEFKS